MRPVRKRKLVDAMCGDWDVSIRRACRVLEVDTSTYHYKSRRPGQAGLESTHQGDLPDARALRLSARPRAAAARGLVDQPEARRDGSTASWACNCATRHRSGGSRPSCGRTASAATRPNETWAMDFVHDQLATGKKLRVLTVVDTFSRFSPVLEPRFSYRGEDVVQTLEAGLRDDRLSRRRSGSTRAPSSSPATSICGPMPARRHARLLAARQADRQCLHRSVQRPLPSGVPERPLVPDALPMPAKSWRIGADTTTRIARTGRSATSRRSRCRIPVTQPARHRERPETLPSGDPTLGFARHRQP